MLGSLGIGLEAVRQKVEETIGPAGTETTGSPPFTPRAKKVLELDGSRRHRVCLSLDLAPEQPLCGQDALRDFSRLASGRCRAGRPAESCVPCQSAYAVEHSAGGVQVVMRAQRQSYR